jgi:signal transduction histidine kinase
VGAELEAASVALPEGPARARLEVLVREAQETLETVRAAAGGIYPPLLAEGGVGAALEAALRASPAVSVRAAADVGRQAQDVEAAVFFASAEAVQNALKHGGEAVRVTISLAPADGGRLRFAVEDDGVGFDPARVARGSGLANIRDRIEAVGGSVRITTAVGRGTLVEGIVG